MKNSNFNIQSDLSPFRAILSPLPCLFLKIILAGVISIPVCNSQSVNVKGVKVNIDQGIILHTGGSLKIEPGGEIDNKGILQIKGDWLNSGNGLVNGSTGTVKLLGTTNQNIGGVNPTQFHHLELNNPSGVTLNQHQGISGDLIFQNGLLKTLSSTLALSALSNITGAAPDKYIHGNLKKYFNAGSAQNFMLAIGDANAYAPVQLNNLDVGTTGSITSYTQTGQATNKNNPVVNASNIHPELRVSRYWNLTAGDGFSLNSTNAAFHYNAVETSGNPLNYVARIFDQNTSSWSATNSLPLNSSSLMTTGLDKLGEVEIGEPTQDELSCQGDLSISMNPGDCYAHVSEVLLQNNIDYIPAPGSTLSFTPSAGNFAAGTHPIQVVSQNPFGQTSCNFNIIVSDTEIPLLNCPSDRTVNCLGDVSPTYTGSATATDNCSDAVVTMEEANTQDPDTGNPGHCIYLITRTWTATDGSDNTSQCIQYITVNDVELPEINCPASVYVDCNENTNSASTGMATGTDVVITESDLSTQNMDPGHSNHYNYTITRTWTATDENDNTAQCTQLIQVRDQDGPLINCPSSVTIQCGVDISSSLHGVANATDNCSSEVQITESDQSTQNPVNTHSAHYNFDIQRTWTAIDRSGNSSECIQTIRVQDLIAPEITCPENHEFSCETGFDPGDYGMADGTDNCSPVTLSFMLSSTQDPDPDATAHYAYSLLKTWKATDVSGNFSECTQSFNIIDQLEPYLICPQNTQISCDVELDPLNTGNPDSGDNCTPVIISYQDENTQGSDPSQSDFYNYMVTRTWTASDMFGNQHSCQQQITIYDNVQPVIFCPPAMTLSCEVPVTPGSAGEATSFDNCSPANLSYLDESTQDPDPMLSGHYNYHIIRTWLATDVSGNSRPCAQSILVEDRINPSITCPLNLTLNCEMDLSINATGSAKGKDNCSPVILETNDNTNQDPDPNTRFHYNYDITRSWLVRDASGNSAHCLQLITVQDTTPPSIVHCPLSLSLNCEDEQSITTVGEATFIDNCYDADLEYSKVDTRFFDPSHPQHYNYTITRTWRARDKSGNRSADCIQIITVQDDKPPFLQCPESLNLSCTEDVSVSATGDVITSDNCGIRSITMTETSDYNPAPGHYNHYNYSIIRSWRSLDFTENESLCSQNITVKDNEKPLITCPDMMTIPYEHNVYPYLAGEASATDNCSESVFLSFTDVSTQSPDWQNLNHYNYDILRTWKARDLSDNTSECLQIFQIRDQSPPQLVCPDPIQVNSDFGICEAIVHYYINAFDSENNASLYTNYNTGEVFNLGTTSIFVVATDLAGNQSSCSFTITVSDNQQPQVVCPGSQTRNTIEGDCHYSVLNNEFDLLSSTDNCWVYTSEYKLSGATHLDGIESLANVILQKGETTVNWVVTDETGNLASCSFTIYIEDVENPSLEVPGNQMRNSNDGSCSYIAIENEFDPVFTNDNCGITAITYTLAGSTTGSGNNSLEGIEFNLGSTDIHWQIEDVSGNIISRTFIVTIVDDDLPEVLCPGDKARGTTNNHCSYTAIDQEFNPTGIGDNCEISMLQYVLSGSTTGSGINTLAGIIFNTGITTVNWKVSDLAGNSSQCTFHVTIGDDDSPVLECIPDAVRITDPSHCNYAVMDNEFNPLEASDNCLLASLTYELTGATTGSGMNSLSNEHFNKGITNVKWTVTDEVGLVSSCQFSVNVVDDEDPVISCVSDMERTTQISSTHYIVAGSEFDLLNSNDNCNIGSTVFHLTGATAMTGNHSLNGIQIHKGTTQINWIVTDESGNAAECSFTLQVIDDTPPVINCPGNQNRMTTASTCSYTALNSEFDPVSFTDNSAVVSVEYLLSGAGSGNGINTLSGIQFDKGVTDIKWIVTDDSGNQSSCNFTVTLADDDPPSLNCPSNKERNTQAGGCNYLAANDEFNPMNATDNCNSPNLNYSLTGATEGNGNNTLSGILLNHGVTTVQWKATDAAGYSTVCSFIVSVRKYGDPSSLYAYVILSNDEVKFKESVVESGGIGVTGNNKKVSLEQNSQVTATNTFVKANVIDVKSGSQVTQKFEARVPSSLIPEFRSNNQASNNDKEVPDNNTTTLSQSIYGKVELGKNSVTTFSGQTDVYIKELEIKEGAVIKFNQATNLMIDKKIKGEKNIKINQENISFIQFYVEEKVTIEEGSIINANIYTQNELQLEKAKSNNRTYMTGQFIADKVESQNYVTWNWNPDYCPVNSNQNLVSNPFSSELQAAEDLSVLPSLPTSTLDNRLEVYPNPASDEAFITLNVRKNDFLSIQLIDLTGNVVLNKSLFSTVTGLSIIPLEIKSLATGIYYIKVTTQGMGFVEPISIIR